MFLFIGKLITAVVWLLFLGLPTIAFVYSRMRQKTKYSRGYDSIHKGMIDFFFKESHQPEGICGIFIMIGCLIWLLAWHVL